MRRALLIGLTVLCVLSLTGCAKDSKPGGGSATAKDAAAPGSASKTDDGSVATTSTQPRAGTPVPGEGGSGTSVAVPGKQLEPIEDAPPQTYGLFDLPTPFSGAEFELVARPYGWAGASEDASTRRLLVQVESAKAVSGQTEKFVDLTGQNALVWLDSGAEGGAKVTQGGKYRIRVKVRPSGKTGALYATSIERVD